MAFPLTRFHFRNSSNFYQTSFNFINVSNFGKSSTTKSRVEPAETSAKAEDALPISEMPAIGVFSIMKSFLKSKISNEPFMFDSKEAMNMWKKLKEIYGPVFRIKLIGEPDMVAITNPDDVEKLFRATMNEPVRKAFFSLKKIRDEATNNFFEKKAGILIENYGEWHRVRSKLQTPMMRPKNIVKYLEQMDNISRDFTDRISELQIKHGEMPNNFQQEIYKWALESVGTVALNRRLGCLDPNLPSDSTQIKLIETVNNLLELLTVTELGFPWWRFIPSPTLKKLKEKHEILLRIVYSHIVEAQIELAKKLIEERTDEEPTLLEILLQTEGLSRKDVLTFMLDMFLAGIDTTSHGLAFTLYLLARNKDKQKKLQEELDLVLGGGKETLTETMLSKLSYLKACIKESLRIFPLAIGSLRLLQEDTILAGYNIPKGIAIVTVNVTIARDEEYFKQAGEFIPERWIGDKPLGPIHPYAALPFSHGTRMCIGRRIAEQEMLTFLARVMHRFNIDYKYEDMNVITRLVAMPSEPLRFEFTERNKKTYGEK